MGVVRGDKQLCQEDMQYLDTHVMDLRDIFGITLEHKLCETWCDLWQQSFWGTDVKDSSSKKTMERHSEIWFSLKGVDYRDDEQWRSETYDHIPVSM